LEVEAFEWNTPGAVLAGSVPSAHRVETSAPIGRSRDKHLTERDAAVVRRDLHLLVDSVMPAFQ